MSSHCEFERDFVCPQTAVEKILAEIWSQVLDIPEVDIYQSFFDLGGDALKCMQVCCSVGKRGLFFPLHQLFRYPTIHELAQHLEKYPVPDKR